MASTLAAPPAFADPVGEAAWRAAVAAVLKGAGVDSLVRRTADGIPVAPLYPAADAPGPGGARFPAIVMGRLDHDGASAADELANGADGLVLTAPGAPAARGFGLGRLDAAGADAALDGVALDRVPLRLEPTPFAGLDALDAVLALARARGCDPRALDLDAGLDPLGDLAGAGPGPAPPPLAAVGAAAGDALRDGFATRMLRADGRPHHEAGATEAQELAAVLASAVAYLRAIERAGVAPGEARRSLSFTLPADADQLLTIAKFRALRRLWARVEEACGLVPAPIRLHAETSWRMMTRRDPHTNLLRGTVACAGAMIGGADSVTVLPHTAPLGLADPAARRLARNVALVLRDEAGLDRVADPAAGSGAFEALTEALCREAWGLFGALEAGGGLSAALADGSWGRRLAAARARRAADLASGERALVGTTVYPPPEAAPAAVLRAPPPAAARAALALPSRRDDELLGPDGAAP